MSLRVPLCDRQRLQAALRELRLERGMSQADLARRLERPQSFVSKYESGERRLDILELRLVCEAVGVPLVEFIRSLEDSLS